MVENEEERQDAYAKLHHWQGIAADTKQSDAGRQTARSEALRCAREIAQYEREQFYRLRQGLGAGSVLSSPAASISVTRDIDRR